MENHQVSPPRITSGYSDKFRHVYSHKTQGNSSLPPFPSSEDPLSVAGDSCTFFRVFCKWSNTPQTVWFPSLEVVIAASSARPASEAPFLAQGRVPLYGHSTFGASRPSVGARVGSFWVLAFVIELRAALTSVIIETAPPHHLSSSLTFYKVGLIGLTLLLSCLTHHTH